MKGEKYQRIDTWKEGVPAWCLLFYIQHLKIQIASDVNTRSFSSFRSNGFSGTVGRRSRHGGNSLRLMAATSVSLLPSDLSISSCLLFLALNAPEKPQLRGLERTKVSELGFKNNQWGKEFFL
ncbi:hypothetical protein [Azotosporobacter soli]|uniref:hypothetical protein n=1 Tax=Azotosporobacter soli TaxID=3055040 RepID=UPI0031FEC5A8